MIGTAWISPGNRSPKVVPLDLKVERLDVVSREKAAVDGKSSLEMAHGDALLQKFRQHRVRVKGRKLQRQRS